MIVRSDGRPTYNFASPLEDVLGRDHARHPRPRPHLEHAQADQSCCRRSGPRSRVYGHVPNVNGPDGRKLSKRHGAITVEEFRAAGLHPRRARQLPRAARLELRRQDDDHVAATSCRALHARARRREPGDVRLREARLAERRVPRAMSPEEYADALVAYLREQGLRLAGGADPTLRRRSSRRRSSGSASSPSTPASCSGRWSPTRRSSTAAAPVLREATAALREAEPFDAEQVEAALRALAERLDLKPGDAFQPIRVAVTGSKIAPACSRASSSSAARRPSSVSKQLQALSAQLEPRPCERLAWRRSPGLVRA